MTTPRNSHEPSSGLMRQVFLPIQPRPGVLRVDALLHRTGVHVGQRVEGLARDTSRIQATSASSRGFRTSW